MSSFNSDINIGPSLLSGNGNFTSVSICKWVSVRVLDRRNNSYGQVELQTDHVENRLLTVRCFIGCGENGG